MSTTNRSFSRRGFCAGACRVVSGATLASVFTGCGGGGTDSPTSPGSGVVDLAVIPGRLVGGSSVEVTVTGTVLANPTGAALVQSAGGVFLLSRSPDTGFTAIDAVCSHESCTVTGSSGDVYVCPCHGSRYDRNGRVTRGPATAALRRFTTFFANDVVTIAL